MLKLIHNDIEVIWKSALLFIKLGMIMELGFVRQTFNDISGFLVFKPHNIYKHRYFQITLEAHSEMLIMD